MGRRTEFLQDMGQAVWSRRRELSAILALFVAWSAVMATGGYYFEGDNQEEFSSWWACFYWAVNTVMMVGYGDMAPVSVGGRVVASVGTVVGVGMILVAGSVLAQAVIAKMNMLPSPEPTEGAGGKQRVDSRKRR